LAYIVPIHGLGVLQMSGFRSLVLALALTAAGTVADAAVYITRADWNAAVAAHVDETVPDLGAFKFIGVGDASVTYGTLTYVQSAALGGNALMLNVGPAFSGQPATLTSSTSSSLPNIRIDLPGFFKAVAFDFGTTGGDVLVKLSNGSQFTAGVPDDDLYSARGFLGLVDNTGFQSVLITAGGALALRNASYGEATTAPAPEPVTWALMLLGFGGLGMALRARRRALMA
jgi:hypothetical protein